ncbi:hypothetical protein C0J52_21095 [Blattella germanica]|nr:hypothetical protein C0J52_21095 [Blattella germanica]
MEPAGVSGTVTVEDQRSYIKKETLHCKNKTEIYHALSEVCGESRAKSTTVSRGRMSTDDDPRPGRPRTKTDERIVKLVADALEKKIELSEARGISPTSVYRIQTHDLKKRKISARWVPYGLTAEPKT